MKNSNAMLLMVLLATAITRAQAQTVTLTATNGQPSSFKCSTNQIITVNSFVGSPAAFGDATISFYDGRQISIPPYRYGVNQAFYTGGGVSLAFAGNAVFTRATNILVSTSSDSSVVALTFTVTTPTVQSSIPANAVVIPTDATGPVQIVLESSADLVNWTSSLPGTYGNTYSNRFFRVRAIAQ